MGRIVTSVIVENVPATRTVRIDALVDTGAGYLTLPMAWKERFGPFALEEEVALQTATQQVVSGTVCGPALVRIEGFRAIHGEVLFVKMDPEEGESEPLLGYIPLEQCGAAVDLIGHRLLPVRYIDAKATHCTDRADIVMRYDTPSFASSSRRLRSSVRSSSSRPSAARSGANGSMETGPA